MSSQIIPISQWGIFPEGAKPAIIAGPCAAESEETLLATATELKKLGVGVLRAGIWKPRTHPNTFEGVGEIGFQWLKAVQKELGMKVTTEVASTAHLEVALKNGVDMIWIGARTSANPFLTKELASALRGVDIPILVKNPINPDIELWLGAIERFLLEGITKIATVHRGFSFYGELKYRNFPYWQLPIEIRRRLPEISLLCDPSHISGKREYVEEISKQAISMGFDGLMIESHIHPEMAKSDAAQQVTPQQLKEILDNLQLRAEIIEDKETEALINDFRLDIDRIDDEIMQLLSDRMDIVNRIGDVKREGSITVLQTRRWEYILKRVLKQADEKQLDKSFVEKLFRLIHQASIEKQF